jgi:peroxisomal coenzyme A diphosphatase NUDT7
LSGAPRGGRQVIPRPPEARPAGPAPWAEIPLADRPLTLTEVRGRCAALPVPAPFPLPRPDAVLAAVLVPLLAGPADEARLVLTKRPDTMPSHQGQIAFPGGKIDPAVDRSARDAALREAEEEIALAPDAVEVLAELPTVGTAVGQFVMTPYVGVVAPGTPLVAHPREVTRVFDVALAELLDPDAYRSEVWQLWGEARLMHFFDLEGETVWGATARILADFLAALTATGFPEPAW